MAPVFWVFFTMTTLKDSEHELQMNQALFTSDGVSRDFCAAKTQTRIANAILQNDALIELVIEHAMRAISKHL